MNRTAGDVAGALRQRILALPDVREQTPAGIHEDAFFVGRRMFMHIHGGTHCDIRLPLDAQSRALEQGDARPHRWAPEAGYVTVLVRDTADIEKAMNLIRISHEYASRAGARG